MSQNGTTIKRLAESTTHFLLISEKQANLYHPCMVRQRCQSLLLQVSSQILSPNLSNALTWKIIFLLFPIFLSCRLSQLKSTQSFLNHYRETPSHWEVARTGLRCNPKASRKRSRNCLISTWIVVLGKGKGCVHGFTTAVPEPGNFVPSFACLPSLASASCSCSHPQLVAQNPTSVESQPRRVPGTQLFQVAGLQNKKISVYVLEGALCEPRMDCPS